jgi:replicative DNA helicase
VSAVPVSPQVRVPPHDLDAETSVLGAILLDPAAITRVLDQITPEDFYRENNGQIFRAAQNLFREGEPIDNVTLAAELAKLGLLDRVGGRAHLALLQESVPTAANVEHYAKIVKGKAYKRRLISAGTHVTGLGYDESLDADEAVNAAQAHVYAISDDKVGSGMEHIYGLLKPAMDRIDAQMASGGGVIGIPSGFHDLDRMTNGFKASDLVIIAGRPSMGKALALDTPIPTPSGWTTMGRLRVGDQVFDERGRPCTVTYATDVQEGRTCYEVVFSDGATIVADAEHQWAARTRAARKRPRVAPLAVLTTAQMSGRVRATDGRLNYTIPTCGALRYPEADLPLGPYALGVWLGDGDGRGRNGRPTKLTWPDVQLIRVEAGARGSGRTLARRYGVSPSAISLAVSGRTWAVPERPPAVQATLRRLGVLGNKHIPRRYLEASPDQRLALLQGLLDADGSIDCLGHVEYTSTVRRLAEDVLELVTTLGMTPRLTADRAQLAGVDCGPRYRVRFKPIDMPVFRLSRKAQRQRPARARAAVRQRAIVEIREVESVPVRCIQVDSPSHLYLAGRSCIPTHNTSFVLNVTLHAAVQEKKPVAIFSLEMSKEQLVERMLCEQARIDAQRLHRGTLSDVEYERLAGALGPLGDAPIFIDDAPTLDDLTMRLKARQARSREGIELIVLDYLQLMQGRSNSGDANRVQEVSAISRALKGIARELSIPVIAISQLSRAPEARPDKRPILSDLRESGCLTADTRLLRADTGAPVSLGWLVEHGCEGVWVWSMDCKRRMQPAPLVKVFSSGVKPVFRLQLATGRTVKASGNHRFLTYGGWEQLDRLQPGDRIATPRRIPAPVQPVPWSRPRLALLAHLIGDGCTLPRQSIHYTSADEANLNVVEDAARREFGIEPRRVQQANWWQLYLPAPYRLTHGRRNPIAAWLDGLGVFGLRSHEKRIPEAVFAARDDDVAWFLGHLWATDGCVATQSAPGLYYGTSSAELADQVALLLARLGIVSKTTVNQKAGAARPGHQVWIRGVDQIRTFAAVTTIPGQRGKALDGLVARLAGVKANTNIDTVPIEVWADVRDAMAGSGTTARALAAGIGMAYCGSTLYKSAPSRQRLARVAAALGGNQQLDDLATDDVLWDRIVAIEPLGEQPVFDGTVAGTHNFVADGILAHNSIEQDADIVMFLYRDDYYNREKSEKPGIAEVIVSKHRNGPTGVVELMFRRELTRFENLERRRPELGDSE